MLVEPKRVQQVVYGQGVCGKMGRDLDVLADGQVGHQVVELEDEPKLVATVLAELLGRQAGQLRAAHVDRAAIGCLQAAHQVQKRRFAAARRAEQHANLAFVHRGGDVVQHRGACLAFAVMLAQIANLQVRRRGGGGVDGVAGGCRPRCASCSSRACFGCVRVEIGGAGCGCGVLSHVALLRGMREPLERRSHPRGTAI